MIEASVRIKNDESKLTKKFLIYDTDIVLSTEDPKLKNIVDEALKEFDKSGIPEDITITIRMTW